MQKNDVRDITFLVLLVAAVFSAGPILAAIGFLFLFTVVPIGLLWKLAGRFSNEDVH